jgi:hypothetical protein
MKKRKVTCTRQFLNSGNYPFFIPAQQFEYSVCVALVILVFAIFVPRSTPYGLRLVRQVSDGPILLLNTTELAYLCKLTTQWGRVQLAPQRTAPHGARRYVQQPFLALARPVTPLDTFEPVIYFTKDGLRGLLGWPQESHHPVSSLRVLARSRRSAARAIGATTHAQSSRVRAQLRPASQDDRSLNALELARRFFGLRKDLDFDIGVTVGSGFGGNG